MKRNRAQAQYKKTYSKCKMDNVSVYVRERETGCGVLGRG